jgi:hypothetical protein
VFYRRSGDEEDRPTGGDEIRRKMVFLHLVISCPPFSVSPDLL